MKKLFSIKWWPLAVGLLLLVPLTAGAVFAQAGDSSISVNACTDQNADGDCSDSVDTAAPADLEACLII